MNRRAQAGSVGVLVAALMGCTTITEDLPARPSAIPVPPPIIDATPGPSPSPGTTPTPRPTATPRPNPSPTPTPPPNNNGKVVKLYIKVEWVVCNGVRVPDSEFATRAKVGCQIQFDATAKDASNKPTTPNGLPRWTYEPMSLVAKANEIDAWAPIVTGKAPGTLAVHASVDGVKSQTLRIQLFD